MPSRFRGNVRRLRYRYLVLRDGERCYVCGQVPLGAEDCITYSLDIDHYDEDKTNDDEDNLRLSCRKCNVAKQNRHRKVDTTGSSDGSSGCQVAGSSDLRTEPRSDSAEKCSSGVDITGSSGSRKPEGVCEGEREKGQSRSDDITTPNTRVMKQAVPYCDGSPEMQANAIFEVKYRQWVLHQVADIGFIPKKEAINAGAELVGCNPATATKYLAKLTSMVGPLAEGRDGTGQMMVWAKAGRSW